MGDGGHNEVEGEHVGHVRRVVQRLVRAEHRDLDVCELRARHSWGGTERGSGDHPSAITPAPAVHTWCTEPTCWCGRDCDDGLVSLDRALSDSAAGAGAGKMDGEGSGDRRGRRVLHDQRRRRRPKRESDPQGSVPHSEERPDERKARHCMQ